MSRLKVQMAVYKELMVLKPLILTVIFPPRTWLWFWTGKYPSRAQNTVSGDIFPLIQIHALHCLL